MVTDKQWDVIRKSGLKKCTVFPPKAMSLILRHISSKKSSVHKSTSSAVFFKFMPEGKFLLHTQRTHKEEKYFTSLFFTSLTS